MNVVWSRCSIKVSTFVSILLCFIYQSYLLWSAYANILTTHLGHTWARLLSGLAYAMSSLVWAYSDKSAHVQVVINCPYDVMSQNELTTVCDIQIIFTASLSHDHYDLFNKQLCLGVWYLDPHLNWLSLFRSVVMAHSYFVLVWVTETTASTPPADSL